MAITFGKKEILGSLIGLISGLAMAFFAGFFQPIAAMIIIAVCLTLLVTYYGYWIGKNGGWKLFSHEDIYYRILATVAFGLLLFLVGWLIAFLTLPHTGFMSGSFMAQKMFQSAIDPNMGLWGANTFGKTWNFFGKELVVSEVIGIWGNVLRLTFLYFVEHLIFIFIFIFALSLVKIGKWTLSGIYFALYTLMWAVTVASNSLPFPTGGNLMSGPLVMFFRYGLWIWFAYLLMLVSTTHFAILETPSWFSGEWHKIGSLKTIGFNPSQKEIFIYAILFLLAACFAEARIFVFYNF